MVKKKSVKDRKVRFNLHQIFFVKNFKKKMGLYLFVLLLTLNLVLAGLNIGKTYGLLIPSQPKPLVVDGVVDFEQFTLEQKIAQMIIVLGVEHYANPLKKMQVGGIHLHAMQDEEQFKEVVAHFQEDAMIPLFVSVDLEGCVNPFAAFKNFTALSDINTLGDAFQKAKEEGQYLHELGATLNFAPVVDLDDQIWNCRSFKGDKEEITELANAYILGMQDEGIISTIKHYPGKTLVIKDPHKYLAAAEITDDDLYPYKVLKEKGSIKSIMVSHLITYGAVNSEGKPSVASERIIKDIKAGYPGLIISDEINMLGLKNFYDSIDEMYIEVFKAGNDVILNFNLDPNEIYHMIQVIKQAVEDGILSEDDIDNSVKKILLAKGMQIKD